MKTILTLLALFMFTGNTYAADYPNKGTVLETMDASIYTYMQVSTDKGPVWLAASKTKVAKGDTIGYPNGNEMTNFTSKSMNRTFDKLIMVDKVKIIKKK